MINRLFVVHGINTPRGYPFATECEEALAESKIKVSATCACWDSTAALVDTHRVFTDKEWRENQITAISEELRHFAAVVEARADVNAVLLGHSMGSVFLNEAERRVQTGLPIVYIGSPFSHPFVKQLFRLVGLYHSPGHSPYLFYNYDDDVAAARLLTRGWARPPRWTFPRRIAVAGKGSFGAEHGHVDYLLNANVARNIRVLFNLS